jgi:hypothetical protein
MKKASFAILLPVLLLLARGATLGLEVPLSREGFQNAWARCSDSKPGEILESYHLGTRQLATGTIDIYLSTPYSRALYRACKQRKPPTQEALEHQWEEIKEERAVYLLVTSIGSPASNFIEPRKGEPSIEHASIRKPAGTGTLHAPISQGRVKKGPKHDFVDSLGMNWGWIFEFDSALFAGDEDIEASVDTTSHRAVIPIERRKLQALIENAKP